MRQYKVETSKSFWKEMEAIMEYIGGDLNSPTAAAKFYSKVISKIKTLSSAPERTHIIEDYYSVKVSKYRLIYKIYREINTVRILHIWYSRRDIVVLLS